ncbi:hypothetical protein AB0M54_24300 [Actinoplanes sp. NPDC051470]
MEPLFTFEAHIPLERLTEWTPARTLRHLEYFRDRVAAANQGGGGDAGL